MIIEVTEQTVTGEKFPISVSILAITKIRPSAHNSTMIYLGHEPLRVVESYAQVRTLLREQTALFIQQALAALVTS